MRVQIAESTAADLPFLRAMLVEAAYWRQVEAPQDVQAALSRPDLINLLSGWGRRGDVGVVAVCAGQRIGAAWYRLWTDAHHSYGYVDPVTPEVAIGVVPAVRGKGTGTALLNELIVLARSRGIRRLSLSVELDNPARRLYQRVGFRTVSHSQGAATMVADFEVLPAD